MKAEKPDICSCGKPRVPLCLDGEVIRAQKKSAVHDELKELAKVLENQMESAARSKDMPYASATSYKNGLEFALEEIAKRISSPRRRLK